MKIVIKAATNSVAIPSDADVIEAETEEDIDNLNDKIKDAESDFDYILSGIEQLSISQANEVINRLHESLQQYISEIASELA